MLEKSTYYILDAQGNQMSMYEHIVSDAGVVYNLAERNIYGSSRLGTTHDTINMFLPNTLPSYGVVGNRNYELSNHLGNVLAVINDVIYPLSSNNVNITSYETGLLQVSDYSPFGVQLDGRTISNGDYRYGFQGQEKDDEVSGAGNSYTAEFWQYDPRLGRRWNIDPVVKHHESPYATFANNPIWFADPNGADTIGPKKTLDETNMNRSMDLAMKSETFESFFESFANPSGENYNITLSFSSSSSGLDEGRLGRSRLLYNGESIIKEDGSTISIPADANLEDFEISVEFSVLPASKGGQIANYDGAANNVVTIVHEMLLHSNSQTNILKDNYIYDQNGKVTGVNGKSLVENYLEHFSNKNDKDHKSLYSKNKPQLYLKASKEIISAVKGGVYPSFPSNLNTPMIYSRESSTDYSPIEFWEIMKLNFTNDMTKPTETK